MSQSAILLCPPTYSPQQLFADAGAEDYRQVPNSGASLSLQLSDPSASGGYVTVSTSTDPSAFISDYQTNPDLSLEFRRSVVNLKPLILDFNTYRLVRGLLADSLDATESNAKDFWLDTDYGWVIRGDRLLGLLASNDDWDWRTPSPPT